MPVAITTGARVTAPGFRESLPDEQGPYAHIAPQVFNEKTGRPAATSTKVGWTLRNTNGRIVSGFEFLINPQGIGRTLGSRATLSATKGGFYVDDFGPAPGQIVLRQLIGEGRYGSQLKYTGREDFQRFLKTIWLPATAGVGRKKYRVFFHDHHFERGFEERIFFPPGGLHLERSVELHGLWRVELQMISLEKYPYGEVEAEKVPKRPASARRYRVKRGDTLEKLIRRLAGRGASRTRRRTIKTRLLELNPFLRKRRKVPDPQGGTKWGRPMKLYPGEVLRLPQ